MADVIRDASESLDLAYTVHALREGTVPANVVLDGEEIAAVVPSVDVELTALDARHGSLTLRFIGGAAAAVKRLIAADEQVVLSLRADEAAPAPKAARA